jgi:hypothetical protein
MSVWNWKIDVGIFEIFLEACDTMARSLRFKLLRYYYCMMLSDTASTKPPTFIRLAVPNCNKGELVSSPSSWWWSQLINMH